MIVRGIHLAQGVFDGEQGRGVARGDTQLAIDGAQVRIDGARANDQRFGHLGIGQSLRDQSQHLYLPPGQVVRNSGN